MNLQLNQRASELTPLLLDFFGDKNRLVEVLESPNNSFSKEDVEFAFKAIFDRLKQDDLLTWVQKQPNIEPISDAKIVCVLAGNIPMVGIQDVLALILVGKPAFIKISKKDAVIIPMLLRYLKPFGFIEHLQFSTELQSNSDWKATHWIFTGDQTNMQKVKSVLLELNQILPNAKSLIRKAGFSVAYIDQLKWNFDEICEAIFRYGGMGCRSVGLIVCENQLIREHLLFELAAKYNAIKSVSQFNDALQYDLAYYRAIGYEAERINNFVISTYPEAWKKAKHLCLLTLAEWKKLKIDYSLIQTIYVPSKSLSDVPYAFGKDVEALEKAQKPPLYWKADQVDTLSWLLQNVH